MGEMASKAQMPTPETALPGRDESIKVSDGVADRLEHRQKLLGNAATIERDEERVSEGAGRKGKAMPAVEETWQGFTSFVCLAQGCSARGNQEMSRHGGGGLELQGEEKGKPGRSGQAVAPLLAGAALRGQADVFQQEGREKNG
eukprot:superscaffoldBa00006170_g21220